MIEPNSTSPGKCTPVWTREYPTAVAIAVSGNESGGMTLLVALAKANADAVWPEGNERDVGMRTIRSTRQRLVTVGAAPHGDGLDHLVGDQRGDADGHDAVDGGPAAPGPAEEGERPRHREPDPGVVGGIGQTLERPVDVGGGARGHRPVDGGVESFELTQEVSGTTIERWADPSDPVRQAVEGQRAERRTGRRVRSAGSVAKWVTRGDASGVTVDRSSTAEARAVDRVTFRR